MVNSKSTSRQRILAAAAAVASESGAGNLSLDAVAQRAGVSKGGLLYNFPTKAKLLQGLVQNHIEQFEKALAQSTDGDRGKAATLLGAYLRACVREHAAAETPPTGVLAAMAEDPDLLGPVKLHKRRLLDRLTAESGDTARMLNAFLVVEGLRSLRLLEMDVLSDSECAIVLDSLISEAEWADGAAAESTAAV